MHVWTAWAVGRITPTNRQSAGSSTLCGRSRTVCRPSRPVVPLMERRGLDWPDKQFRGGRWTTAGLSQLDAHQPCAAPTLHPPSPSPSPSHWSGSDPHVIAAVVFFVATQPRADSRQRDRTAQEGGGR